MHIRTGLAGIALLAMTSAAGAEPVTLKMAYFGGPKNPTYQKVMLPLDFIQTWLFLDIFLNPR